MIKHKGFTVVELLVVIVVIAILASIVIVSYSWLRGDATDSKIRAVVKTAGDAEMLYEGQGNDRLSHGEFSVAGGIDTLVSKKILKVGYRDGLSSKNVQNANKIFLFKSCPDSNKNGPIVIYASLNNPTSDDINNFNNARNQCGHMTSVPASGANTYNYAQIF